MVGIGGRQVAELLRWPDQLPIHRALCPTPQADMAAQSAPPIAKGSLSVGRHLALDCAPLAQCDHPPPVAEPTLCRSCLVGRYPREETVALAGPSGSARGAPGNRCPYRPLYNKRRRRRVRGGTRRVPGEGPGPGLRRDAPVPMTAAQGASRAGIYPQMHGNATKRTKPFTLSSRLICIIHQACVIIVGARRRAIRKKARRSVSFDWGAADAFDNLGRPRRFRKLREPGAGLCPVSGSQLPYYLNRRNPCVCVY